MLGPVQQPPPLASGWPGSRVAPLSSSFAEAFLSQFMAAAAAAARKPATFLPVSPATLFPAMANPLGALQGLPPTCHTTSLNSDVNTGTLQTLFPHMVSPSSAGTLLSGRADAIAAAAFAAHAAAAATATATAAAVAASTVRDLTEQAAVAKTTETTLNQKTKVRRGRGRANGTDPKNKGRSRNKKCSVSGCPTKVDRNNLCFR